MKNKKSGKQRRIFSLSLYIANDLYRFGSLFVALPLQAIIFEQSPMSVVIYTYTIELSVIAVLLFISYSRYLSLGIRRRKGSPEILKSGMVIRLRDRVFYKKYTSVTAVRKPFYLPRGDSKLTEVSGKFKKDIFLKRGYSDSLIHGLFDSYRSQGGSRSFESVTIRSEIFPTLLMSVAVSNALTGLLYIVPLFRGASRLLGESNAQALLAPVGQNASSVFSILPPVLSLVSGIILVLWTAGSTAEFLRIANLSIAEEGELLHLRRGILTERHTVLSTHSVSAVITRQPLISLLFGLCYCEALIPSASKLSTEPMFIGRRKGERACRFYGVFAPTDTVGTTVTASKSGLFGYMYLPLSALSALSIVYILIDAFFTLPLSFYILLLFLIPTVIWFFFRFYAFKRSRLFISQSHIEVTTFRGLSLLNIIISKEAVRAVVATQSIPARHHGRCNLRIYIRSNRRYAVKILQIDKEKATELLS